MTSTRMRRLLTAFLLCLVPVAWLATRYEPFQVDGDAVSYMDLADLIHAHRWAGVVNGYWHPLYPATLALAQVALRPTRWTELGAYYAANYGIFLLEVLATLFFVAGLARLRAVTVAGVELRAAEAALPASVRRTGMPLLDRTALSLVGLAVLVIASQRELSMGKVRPDALLQALMLGAFGALLYALASESLVYPVLMGLCFGLAYLTKSFAFVVALLSVAVLVGFGVWARRATLARLVMKGGLALLVFALVAGPYVAALSHQKGRFDFGDSGALNYAWYSGGTQKMHLEPWMTASFGSAIVELKHPEQRLMASPGVYSYRAEPYGTYPDWFDTTFFNERVTPHLNPPVLLHRDLRNLVLVGRYLLNHPEGWVLLGVLLLCGARLRTGSLRADGYWVPPVLLGLAMWGLYGLVNVEERYVTLAYLLVLLPLFAMLREREGSAAAVRPVSTLRATANALVVLLAFVALAGSVRIALEERRSGPAAAGAPAWMNATQFGAARGLAAMGVRPGEEIACLGAAACLDQNYWARLAGVRVLTEVYNPDTQHLYAEWRGLPNREQVLTTLQGQGARVLVAQFDPGAVASDGAASGWVRLGSTDLFALPLDLGTPPVAVDAEAANGRRVTAATPIMLPWTTTLEGAP